MTNQTKVVPLFTIEARIKRTLRRHLQKIGFIRTETGFLNPPNQSKETIRALHNGQRNGVLKKDRDFIKRSWPKLEEYFANGSDIIPGRIHPELEIVKGRTWQSDLFRLASLTWSVPVSQGYGRRLRFLVWDKSNKKLIGLVGLGDPVFNLKVREKVIGWTVEQKTNLLVNVMDAYVLGAIPPYNLLLCGKMVACLIRTREVRDHFKSKYENTKGFISGTHKHAKLVAVTTSSALGRSSLYNRLALNGTKYFKPIGFTVGWGHFHIPNSLFKLIREYLELKGHRYAGNNRYGDGPNWRLRAIRQTMNLLNLNPNLLRHGISREVFLCELASNAKRYLTGRVAHPQFRSLLSVDEVAKASLTRWILPRSMRRTDYQTWSREGTLRLLIKSNTDVFNPTLMKERVEKVGSSEL